MANYKSNCIHCNELIDRESRFCPKCGSRSPFGYNCPTCLKKIEKKDFICSSCGRELNIICPVCNQKTFVDEKCEKCGASLMIKCQNPRCGEMQFFENKKCTACGKKIKIKKKIINI
ncbi:MAG: hypothetical protein LBR30_00925 [Clostridioides sp.]|jgi:RNA polymerase subunit RPABC4/transcription elongation factor Spt4|nr:hypothetical protein [Clostridioides sp.]